MPDANQATSPSVMTAFDFPSQTRVVFGVGCVGRVGELARELGAQHVLSKPFWSKGLLDAVDKALAVCEKENG